MTTINGIEYPEELLKLLKPGNVLRANMNYPIPNEVYHVRTVIDEDQVVVTRWLKSKQRWHYEIIWFYSFLLKYKSGNLEFVKKEKL